MFNNGLYHPTVIFMDIFSQNLIRLKDCALQMLNHLFFPPCSIITCAITMKYYVEENVSQRSCTTIRHVVKMLATVSETLIFFFLGVVTITTDHEWNWAYILFTLLFAFIWRGLGELLILSGRP